MKKILGIMLIMISAKIVAQVPIPPVYFDKLNQTALRIEEQVVKKLAEEKTETSKEWAKTLIGSTAEEEGLTTLGKPKRHVNFIKYANMCESFINGKKRKLCEEKVEYLRHSHNMVFELLSIKPLYKMRKGIKDLIWKKYAAISHTIITKLEKIKREAEKAEQLKDQDFKG